MTCRGAEKRTLKARATMHNRMRQPLLLWMVTWYLLLLLQLYKIMTVCALLETRRSNRHRLREVKNTEIALGQGVQTKNVPTLFDADRVPSVHGSRKAKTYNPRC